MRSVASIPLLYALTSVLAHGNHVARGPEAGETIQQYARRHMASEHHIDSFDIPSFFQLHDLNRDGLWDREEIEAIYGVHHLYSQKKSKDEVDHQKKADHIVNTVLERLDADKDGKISPGELEKGGLDGLPNFDHMGAEGHHYDVESEFFLHHEEQYHSTPETQTDESYTHPEDLEHFQHHEEIELKEAQKEAVYQGISVEEVLNQHQQAEAQAQALRDQAQHKAAPHPHDDQLAPQEPFEVPNPKVTRVPPPEKQDPSVKYKTAKSEAAKKGEWGTGADGYKPPTNPSDRMRKNLPYKYKFRRSWGDF